MAGDENFPVPTDVFVAILMHLPASCRRRLRLVCKGWRDVVDERTPERQVRTKVVAFINKRRSSRALVFDDDRRREWTFPSSGGFAGVVDMVGTCNGLLCLHKTAPCGDRGVSVLTVVNPVTGETRRLPPVPPARSLRSLGRYVFGYHPITGRYKVVHIPSSSSWMLDAVQVLDLGEASWREVKVPLGGSCNHSCGAVSVDGSVYWLTARADQVMSLDLDDDERVAFLDAPPTVRPVKASSSSSLSQAECRLTNVQARLGVAVTRHELPVTMKVDVWVLELEGGRERRRRWWSRWYSVVEPSGGAGWSRSWVTAPHFTHGEYVLRRCSLLGKRRLYRIKLGGKGRAELGPSELIMSDEFYGALTTFAYVETHEPLPSIL